MKNKVHSPNWGGSRANAGRKPQSGKRGVSSTKVVRVPIKTAELIQSGRLEELLAVINDWEERISSASKTSPRWKNTRVMMRDIQNALHGNQPSKNEPESRINP